MPIREVVRHSNMRGKATVQLAVAILGLLVQQFASFLGSPRRPAGHRQLSAPSCRSSRRAEPETRTPSKTSNFAAVRRVVDAVPDIPLVVRAMVGVIRMDAVCVPPGEYGLFSLYGRVGSSSATILGNSSYA